MLDAAVRDVLHAQSDLDATQVQRRADEFAELETRAQPSLGVDVGVRDRGQGAPDTGSSSTGVALASQIERLAGCGSRPRQ